VSRWVRAAWRLVRGLPVATLAAVVQVFSFLALIAVDALVRKGKQVASSQSSVVSRRNASIVIPNWNGKELLEKYLPSVVKAMEARPGSEAIVVDNGSTDGSAEFVADKFPQVKLLRLNQNLGFGGGSNAGVKEARHDIVVLLNSDMRVEADFLAPLLDGFADPDVFAVACQIFFSDPARIREETGLTEGWWQQGALRVRHRADDRVNELFPCFYGGGGSCAFDREKFLELGGFDSLYEPFYLEDTDLGYRAWKRGWKVLYQPASVVYHEHRGTIGRMFHGEHIQAVLKKNYILFTWKNIHDFRMLVSHFFFTWANATLSWLFGDSPERANFASVVRAGRALPHTLAARARARKQAVVGDREAFSRPLGGYFRDREPCPQEPLPGGRGSVAAGGRKLSVLFVSPYPICPPVHGGGVFMHQTVTELARLCDLHLIVLLDFEKERGAHEQLDQICASTEYIVRMEGRQKAFGSMEPHAAREFRNRDLAWLIHRQIYLKRVDVLQLEYIVMAQYAGQFRTIPSIVFEHDIYFQSIARRLPFMTGVSEKIQARWEYLRALRYELRMLRTVDRVQVCSREQAEYLASFLPDLRGRIDDEYRAGVDTSLYEFRADGREPFTMLFLGSFRHAPNQEALNWFVRQVLPRLRMREPRAKLVVIGAEPPPRHALPDDTGVELRGFVEDVREPLGRYAVFVCPILSGSGVRVKLLEAFAAGIPVVSTRLGAEGLTAQDGHICALADDAEGFASRVVELLTDPLRAQQMAKRARADVVARRDVKGMTERLVEGYRREVSRKSAVSPGPRLATMDEILPS
jgi:O-antigen biosynthesis protein